METRGLGPYSQNILSQICKIFVTLGIKTLRFIKTKSFFYKEIVDVTYSKNT